MKLFGSKILLIFSSLLFLLLDYPQICLGASTVPKNVERGRNDENEVYGTVKNYSVENSHILPLESKIRLLKKYNPPGSFSRVSSDPLYYLQKPFFDRDESVYGKIVRFKEETMTLQIPFKHFHSNVIVQLLYCKVWFLLMVNQFCMILLTSLNVYHNLNNIMVLVEKISMLMLHIIAIFNNFYWKRHENEFYKMLDDIRIFVETSDKVTKKLFNGYINRYVIVVILINVFSVPSIVAMICGPIFLPQLFPLVDIYPFEVEKFTVLYYFLFFMQVVSIYQLLVNTMVIFNSVVLLSYIVTEFKVLIIEIHKVIEKYEDRQLNVFIKKHIQCIEYAQNLDYMLRYMILRCFVTVIVTVIFAAIPILLYTKIFEMIRGIAIVITALMCVLAFTFPADDLYEMGTKIANAVYDSNWVGTSLSLQKSVVIIMCAAQKPLVIKVDGILPALTCKFYASFLSMTLSYFATLRAVIESE